MHLASKAFIEEICPTPSHYKKKKASKSTEQDDEEYDFEEEDDLLDDEVAWLASLVDEVAAPEDKEIDDEMDFNAGDLLGKVLALINQVQASPQAKVFFATMCHEEGLTPLELIKWIRTHWGSMYDLINHMLTNHAAVDKFCLLADASPKVPNLKKKKYSDFAIAHGEWQLLQLVHEVLCETRDAQATFASESHPTVWRTIPMLEYLQQNWETLANIPKFAPVKKGIEKGLEKLHKWYMATDQTDIYFICLALEPSVKLEYAKQKWDKSSYDKGLAALKKAFDSYYVPPALLPSQPRSSTAGSLVKPKGFAVSFIQAAVRGHVESEHAGRNARQELLDYLCSPLDPSVEDPILWWGHHQTQYLTLAKIARDYLAIQGSSVPSEHTFSGGGLMDTKAQNQLSQETFEALQILKSCYKDGLIKVEEEVAAHERKPFVLIGSD
ncbi:hypothetical protein PILCRDRAFT_13838 [Piloderma croceum F 1598]|uniref:HAT C-terminal dimerisation domain-containing protein n=1 Tax=Piloderma croceum (strain F 1598) TaxID=765440 RepID=A0A0C3ERH1_PILCF|nr:hypothetical protein PILCRDRAFT_13838 [Piloderma croceum F 1598]